MAELRRLRYFLAVAEARNFTRAAERLHVAQPALSRQVRELERDLGVELLRRSTHAVELTEAGEQLLRRGPAVVAAVDDLWRGVRAYGEGARGTVVLAYGPSAGYETAPRLLALVASEPVLLHPRDANPGHYDAVVELYRAAGIEPVVRLRPLMFDLAQTPVAMGTAVAVVGESAAIGMPATLAWRPLDPAVTFDTALVVRAVDRTPAVERLVAVARVAADELGWLGSGPGW